MSRRKLLTRGVMFSYLALAAQIGYSFASIPLALSHLSTAEFGMWGVIMTVGSYLMLAEFGMTESFVRHLFECKDESQSLRYGRLFTASITAHAIVSLVVLAAGVVVSLFAAPMLGIPESLRRDFMLVMLGNSLLGTISMATKMLGIPLILHHRQDLIQIQQIGVFVIYYASLYLGFKSGWGIYAMLSSQAAGFLWCVHYNALACWKLGYFPRVSTLGLPQRHEWREIWSYSMNNFAIQIGGTILAGLPQLLISSRIGLDAAGLWTVCTRVFGVLRQIAVRPFSIAIPMLTDLYVNGQIPTAVRRWTHICQVMMATSALFFGVACANNSRFIKIWTGIESGWGSLMQLSIAFYFLCYVAAGCPYGVIGFGKKFGWAGIVPILQAVFVSAVSLIAVKWTGSAGIVLISAAGFLFGMLLVGMRHLGRVTVHDAFHMFLHAIARPFLTAPLVYATAAAVGFLTASTPGYPGLLLSTAMGFLIGLPLVAYLGVSGPVRREIMGMVLKPLHRLLPSGRRPASATDGPDSP